MTPTGDFYPEIEAVVRSLSSRLYDLATDISQLSYIDKIVTGEAQAEDPDSGEFAALFATAQGLLQQ